jgi:hypothetical protein
MTHRRWVVQITAEWLCLAVVVALTVLWWVPQRHGPIDARSDGAICYILGTSLAEGRGYRLLNEPGDIQAVQYPPLLPLLVAVHQKALGTGDFAVVGRWLRGFYFLVSLALAVSGYWLARQYLSARRALLASAVCGLALHVWYLAGVLYTEVPLALLAVLFATCARRASRGGYWLATAALGVAASLLRVAGIALLIAWVIEALIGGCPAAGRARGERAPRRLAQAAARAAVLLLPIVAWQAFVGSVTSSRAYRDPVYPYQRAAYQYSNVTYRENIALVSPFTPERGRITPAGAVHRFLANVAFIVPSLGGAVTAQRGFWEVTIDWFNRHGAGGRIPPWLAFAPMTALGLVVLAGAAVMLRRGQWLLPICCVATAGLMCVTPWPEQFVRYFAPMIPFLSIMLVLRLGTALDAARADTSPSPKRRLVLRSLALAVLAVVLLEDAYVTWWTFWLQPVRTVTYYDGFGRATSGRLLYYDAAAAALDAALDQVRQRAQAGDVLVSSMPHWAYLRTGVKAILPPMEANRDEARRLLDAVPVRFVVLDALAYPGISQRYAAPAVEGQPASWKQIYRTPDGGARVYERAR